MHGQCQVVSCCVQSLGSLFAACGKRPKPQLFPHAFSTVLFSFIFFNLQFKSRRFCLQVTAPYVCSGFTTWPSRLGRGRNWVDEDAWRAWKIWRVDDRVDFLLFYIAYLTSRTSHSKCDCVSAVPSRTLWSLRPRQESAGYVGAWLAFLVPTTVVIPRWPFSQLDSMMHHDAL